MICDGMGCTIIDCHRVSQHTLRITNEGNAKRTA